jgi:CDGSH-type Zn-finger protein/truncated hemoglobin YjbI
MYLERPEGMDLEDAAGLAAFHRAAPAVEQGDIVPRGQGFAAVGHLYRSIEAGIAHLADEYGEQWLFVGPPRAQATQRYFRWPELIAVTGAASAQRAIDEILEQGEGPRGHWQNAHFGQFVAIGDEYLQLRDANPAFNPVRPSIPGNVRPAERDQEVALVTDLFNVSYEVLLTMLQRLFAHTEETDAKLKALADATVALMLRVIKPLGDLVTTLPAGPEYPGRTAGPSFELFYESDYVLPHREAAWILLIERLEQAAEFCQPGVPCEPGVADGLDAIRAALIGIAATLTAQLPARDVRPAPAPTPAELLPPLLARADDYVRTAQIPAHQDNVPLASLSAVLRSAYLLTQAQPADVQVVARLVNSVLRPLAETLQNSAPGNPAPGNSKIVLSGSVSAETVLSQTGISDPAAADAPLALWDVALAATKLRGQLGTAAPAGLLEAVAALQDLACRQATQGERPGQIAELGQLQDSLPPAIATAKNGPYLVTNAAAVRGPLGDQLAVPPQLALCRCGGSAMMPLCDGTHSASGFTDGKDPHRVPDQRDTYLGEQVTIFDNRGICQHSGLCTNRLATVFRTSQEPFVAPSGGRLDEIVRAARDCPSGALSLGFDGDEARDLADWHGRREPAIEVSQDGPYRVTGAIPLTDAAGGDVPRAVGASREHYALCRCGHSQNKPFCSGMHWYVEFRDPVRAPGSEPTLFEWAGGLPALTRMTRLLYEKHVPADGLLAPLFAKMPPGYPQAEAGRLAEAFGAPATTIAPASAPAPASVTASAPSSATAPSSPTTPSDITGSAAPAPSQANQPFAPEQLARWVTLATRAADEAGLPADPEFRAALASYLDWSSRTGTPASAGPAGAPGPRGDWSPAGPPAEAPHQLRSGQLRSVPGRPSRPGRDG